VAFFGAGGKFFVSAETDFDASEADDGKQVPQTAF